MNETNSVAKTKRNSVSVYLDDELALALYSIRERLRLRNQAAEPPSPIPTIGWLARTMLREKLGLGSTPTVAHDDYTSD